MPLPPSAVAVPFVAAEQETGVFPVIVAVITTGAPIVEVAEEEQPAASVTVHV